MRTRRGPQLVAVLWLALVFAFVLVGTAHAEMLEAPVGGAPIALGEGRVACVRAIPNGWVLDASGRFLRPPTTPDAVGTVVDLRVARSPAACAQDATTVRLVATAVWPVFDANAVILAIDEGRLRARGQRLADVTVSWPSDQAFGVDVCREPKTESGAETCAWNVAKTIPALPSSSVLRWWPAGAQAVPDAILFGLDGKRAAPEAFTIVPTRVELMDLLPAGASVDVSAGVGRVALSHPDAVSGLECAATRCSIESDALLVQAPPGAVSAVEVRFRLAPRIVYVRKSPPDVQPSVRLPILRCPMTIPSGPPLRGVDGARAVVRVEGACMRDVASLGFLVGSTHVDVAQIVTASDAAYAVLELGTVRAPEVAVTAVRGDGDGTVVAMAHVETRAAPVVHTTLEITGFPPIDFIPNNRRAIVHVPHVAGAELALLSVTDVYDAVTDRGVTTVQGDVNAVGLIALQFGYRVPTLPRPLDTLNLAVLTDALQRSVKEANIPAPFGLTAASALPLAEIVCSDEHGAVHRIIPGVVLHLPFSARFGCRVILHRERLSPEYGTQKLTLEIEVDKVDNTSRSEAHVTQTIVLRAGGRGAGRLDQRRRRTVRPDRRPPLARRRRGALPRGARHRLRSTRRAVVERLRRRPSPAVCHDGHPDRTLSLRHSGDERCPLAEPRSAIPVYVARRRGTRGPAWPRGWPHGVRPHGRHLRHGSGAYAGRRRGRARSQYSDRERRITHTGVNQSSRLVRAADRGERKRSEKRSGCDIRA